MAKMMLGPIEVTSGREVNRRIALLLWGAAGCGKTVFAATAPGKKLWISMGDNEHVSVAGRKDVMVADWSGMPVSELFKHAQTENPFGLDQLLSQNEEIETVVLDSLTALTYLALVQSVEKGVGSGKRGFIPTIEEPGQAAYGGRNAIVLKVVTGVLRVTAKHNVHIIITAHEADPTKMVQDGKEIIDFISVQLGGQLVNNMSFRLSEIWYMSERAGERRIAIRPTRLRRPMKTRMFSGKGDAEFVLEFDSNKPDKGQMTIARWYDEWCDGGGVTIMPPAGPKRRETK